MESINSVKNRKRRSIPQRASEYEYIEDEILAFFPQSTYFQIHFQYCHENVHMMQQELRELKEHVIRIEDSLERIMKTLDKPSHEF